ncbi:zonular occludens toxin domain-containing protein [Clostridium perfringens]|uniref:zonular occludens toxin domain-containing protein n=1 Tax=Clostridium perfringens TaxID=1502 RepID=UPI0024BD1495|nr:FtsK/SpoIIIE domain-containing protein [Clostridium perfringens]
MVNSTNLKGEDIKKNIVVYSPEIYYKVEKDYIFIKFRLDGSKYENNYIELEKNISNILKLKTMSELKLGEIEYKCLLKNIKPIICGSEIEGQVIKFVDSEKIYLTEDLAWNFRKHPHALITGVTGGGKTYLLYWIIRNLYSINSELKIIDPKMADLDYLKNFLDNSNVASSIGNIIRILRESSEIINLRNLEFQKRADYMQGKDYKDYGYKPIFVIFDEVTAFFASCDSKQSKEANGYLQEIIMKGRSAGVFVILTTQRADTDVISGKIRDQLSLRISMGQLSKDGYTMTFGNEYKDLNITMVGYVKDKPNTGVGYLYIDGVISKPQEFYSPVLNNGYNFFEDIKKLIINKKI